MVKARIHEYAGRKRVTIMCPGCKDFHTVPVNPPQGWGFNDNLESPTLTPSILLKTGHFSDLYKNGDNCWCTYNAEHKDNPAPFKCFICHSFVTDGKIRYLTDSTHELAGQIVDLPELEQERNEENAQDAL